ncbi:hypothetical protein B0H11DRAFT_1974878, partial [Mycena galericulata]
MEDRPHGWPANTAEGLFKRMAVILEKRGLREHVKKKPPAQLAGTLLPKFHCELNFIKQVWGYAKWIYRFYPASFREDDLVRNVREMLAAIPLPMAQR